MARSDTVCALLQLHPRTHMEQAGITVQNKPAALFRVLCATLLFSARISADLAVAATRALAEANWTTPQKMADSSWQRRAQVLNQAGYARYDERTAAMLGEAVALLLDRYGGDLRRLRAHADRDPERERALLTDFKGIGEVGAAIFCREVQPVWPELHPFADDRSLAAARRLDLGDDPGDLARLVDRADLPRVLSALVRVDAEDDYDWVRAMARGDEGAGAAADEQAGEDLASQSKRQLYEQAKRLGVAGRSKMDKAQLARAVQRAAS